MKPAHSKTLEEVAEETIFPLSNSYLLHSKEVKMYSFSAEDIDLDSFFDSPTNPCLFEQQPKTYDASPKEETDTQTSSAVDTVYEQNDHIGRFIKSLLADGLTEKYFIVTRTHTLDHYVKATTFNKTASCHDTVKCSTEITTKSDCFNTVLGMMWLSTSLFSLTSLDQSPLLNGKKHLTVFNSVAFGISGDDSAFTKSCQKHRHPLALLNEHLNNEGVAETAYEILLTKNNILRLLYSGKL